MAGPVQTFFKGAVDIVSGIFGFLSGDPPQQFDKLKNSFFLQFVVQQAATTGIPVVFCWFDSMVQMNPDGSFFAFALIDSCVESPRFEAQKQSKFTIYVVRCLDGVDFNVAESVRTKCSFILREGPGLMETIIDRVEDFVGFDDTGIIPQPTLITPGEEPDPETGQPADFSITERAGLLPSNVTFGLVAVGAILLFGLTRGR